MNENGKEHYHVEEKGVYRDLPYVCLALNAGHRCGYVGVGSESCLFGIKYNKPNYKLQWAMKNALAGPIGKRGVFSVVLASFKTEPRADFVFDVHGSITFSAGSDGSNYPIPTTTPTWWLGFDCAHAGDGKDLSLVTDSKLQELYSRWPNDGIIRTTKYVVAECKSLIDQIHEVEELYLEWRRIVLFRRF